MSLKGRQAKLDYLFDLGAVSSSAGLSEEEFYSIAEAWKKVELLNGDFLRNGQETWSKNNYATWFIDTFKQLGKDTADASERRLPKERFVAFYSKALESLEEEDFAMGLALSLLAIDMRHYADADRQLGDTGGLPFERRDYMMSLVKALASPSRR